jgi:hypothetical protein
MSFRTQQLLSHDFKLKVPLSPIPRFNCGGKQYHDARAHSSFKSFIILGWFLGLIQELYDFEYISIVDMETKERESDRKIGMDGCLWEQ